MPASLPQRSVVRRLIPWSCCAVVLALPGCAATDLDWSQLPDLIRLVSDPPGADVQIEGNVARFVTPCDVRRDTLRGRAVTIAKEGYLPFRGTLAEMLAGERGMFRVVLRKP